MSKYKKNQRKRKNKPKTGKWRMKKMEKSRKNFKGKSMVLGTLMFILSTTGNAWCSEVLLDDVVHQEQCNNNGLCWVNSDGSFGPTKICGPVALLTIDEYIGGTSPSTQKVKDMIDWMVAKNIASYGSGANSYCGYITDFNDIIQIAKGYYGYTIYKHFNGSNFNLCIQKIKNSLDENRPVVLGTYIDMIVSKGGHFMVVDGLRDNNNDGDFIDDSDQVHVTDPGHNNGVDDQKWYPISTLRNAFQGIILLDNKLAFTAQNEYSEEFSAVYNQYGGKATFGAPWSNGSGGAFLHQYPDANCSIQYPNVCSINHLWVQDFLNAKKKIGHQWLMLVLNKDQNKVWPVNGPILYYWTSQGGYATLGAPMDAEWNGRLTGLTKDLIIVQHFRKGTQDFYLGWNTNDPYQYAKRFSASDFTWLSPNFTPQAGDNKDYIIPVDDANRLNYPGAGGGGSDGGGSNNPPLGDDVGKCGGECGARNLRIIF